LKGKSTDTGRTWKVLEGREEEPIIVRAHWVNQTIDCAIEGLLRRAFQRLVVRGGRRIVPPMNIILKRWPLGGRERLSGTSCIESGSSDVN
jgi:hypothetical protein